MSNFKYTKPYNIEDLLGRFPIKISVQNINKYIQSKTILITGAAGSIGSEIVRQILSYNPNKTIIIDQAESQLHELLLELEDQYSKSNITSFLGDIRNYKRMEQIISEYKPDIIFHAAAYKHVPMLEKNPSESILVNVKGTKNLADLAVKYNVEKFVMISTDKAVNPTNVMGASKRIAEIYVQSFFNEIKKKKISKTQFITTRFGNVLGSNGSVIPLFKKQIEKGGPVTITHPDITRFFMTIPEACTLVLEAGSMGNGGEIFIFDMGEPVKILDLATKMIQLSGYKPNEDIKIIYTGLRPGEKLFEELLNNKEITHKTHNPQIMIASVREYEYSSVLSDVEELIKLSNHSEDFLVVSKMKKIVPEFISKNSMYEQLDIDLLIQ